MQFRGYNFMSEALVIGAIAINIKGHENYIRKVSK